MRKNTPEAIGEIKLKISEAFGSGCLVNDVQMVVQNGLNLVKSVQKVPR